MNRALHRLLFAAETIVLTVVVVIAFQAFVAQPYRVEHGSMLSTLHDGEMVLVDKLTPRLGGVHRGDIIVFDPPARDRDDGAPFIKRVIGLPGERVELRRGLVWVDGVALDESGYLDADQATEPTDTLTAWDVPPHHLFVLGDHRRDSTDSRMAWLGMVPLERVIGRAAARYWPIDTATVLGAPSYPGLAGTAAARVGQAPTTQPSMARP